MCAERVAIFTAVAAGQRQIQALAVIADTPQPVVPCGLCLQVLAEFSLDCQVIMANMVGEYQCVAGEATPALFDLSFSEFSGKAKLDAKQTACHPETERKIPILISLDPSLRSE